MEIEQEDYINYKDNPWEIRNRYFQHNWFPPLHNRTRIVAEHIITETQSGAISHTLATPNDPNSIILYSKIVIQKIILPSQWGLTLDRPRQLSTEGYKGLSYNYWDYIQAWTNVLLIQNPSRSHSWFFKTCYQLYSEDIPNWFLQWWEAFGPTNDIFEEYLPKDLYLLYTKWTKVHPALQPPEARSILPPAKFIIDYSLPWIMSWDLKLDTHNNGIPILVRVTSIKWWSSTIYENQLQSLPVDIAELEAHTIKKNTPQTDNNPFEAIKASVMKRFPHLNEEQISHKCLEIFKEKFLKSFGTTSMDTESQSSSMHEREAATDEDEDNFAQNPNIDTPDLSDVGDFWDKMTALLAQKK